MDQCIERQLQKRLGLYLQQLWRIRKVLCAASTNTISCMLVESYHSAKRLLAQFHAATTIYNPLTTLSLASRNCSAPMVLTRHSKDPLEEGLPN